MFRWLKAWHLALPLTLLLTLALAALSLFSAGCSSSSPAQIRFVHTIQDAGPLDIEVNGTQEFTSVSFLGVQPNQPGYTSVASGNDTMEGFLTGTTTEAFTDSVSWGAGTQHTMIATGFSKTGANGSNVVLLSVPDNNSAPPAGDVEFRVIHASPSGPPLVDVYIALNPSPGPQLPITFQGLAYMQASKYFAIAFNPNNATNPPGYTVYVTISGTTPPSVIFSEEINPSNAGAIRTLVLTDVQNGTTMQQSFLELSDMN